MAKLPLDTIENIFGLQQRQINCLDSITDAEFKLFELYGETSETLQELGELQNMRELLTSYYSRLGHLLLKVAESQPAAPNDMLDLLYRSIDAAEAGLAASNANLREIKLNWSNL
jgi:hypothetical protein